jgi:flagellar hook-associated protein FlgK
MANVKQQLEIPAVPSLGTSGIVYSENVQNQNNGLLRLFFTKLVNSIQSVIGPSGGKFLNNPHGAFQDSTDQVAANTTTAYAVTFNTTDFSNGVTIASSSRITVADAGIWNLQFSIQFTNTTNASQDVDVWFRVNGTNVTNSNSRFGFAPRKDVGDPFHIIAAMNYFASLNATDYVEIMWRPTDVGVTIEQYAASASPTRPAVPSAIVTISFVSNLPTL